MDAKLSVVQVETPKDANVIIGQTHFVKSAEDLYFALADSAPGVKFGVAFCEASGKCLVRSEGNDEELKSAAEKEALKIGAGHVFVVFVKNAFPINCLNAIKNLPEVCSIYCATANPVQVIVAETGQGRGVMGVVDGSSPKGVEGEADVKERREMLKKFGYRP